MNTYKTKDGIHILAENHGQFMRRLRASSRDPREDMDSFCEATARAAHLQTGEKMRSASPTFLAYDLIDAGLVTLVDWPKIGDGATICRHSDRQACTITYITPTGKTLNLQYDHTELDNWKPKIQPGGFAGHCTNNATQKYKYERDSKGYIESARLRKDGRYYTKCGSRITPGRHHFHDYNF